MVLAALPAQAWDVHVRADEETGGLVSVGISGDPAGMNWIQGKDCTNMPWVTSEYRWGTGTLKANGQAVTWNHPISNADGCAVYRPVDGLEIRVRRQRKGDGLEETYEWRNVSAKPIELSEIDVHTPFRDDYLPRREMWTRRCFAHVWAGGSSAWVCAMRMGGKAPHLGLAVTAGAVDAYEIKLRGQQTGSSDYRGVIALSPPDVTLVPGSSASVSWRLFPFADKTDFFRRVRELGGVSVTASDWTVTRDEPVDITFEWKGGKVTKRVAYVREGLVRVPFEYANGKRTHAELNAIADPFEHVLRRARFLVAHQQVNEPDSPYYGAFTQYDMETGRQRRWWEVGGGPDMEPGAERLGIGVSLAVLAQLGYKDEFLPPLRRYADFILKLCRPDNYVYASLSPKSRKRDFNSPWAVEFFLEMYKLTDERRYLTKAYELMLANVLRKGTLIEVESPDSELVKVLRSAGLTDEADRMVNALVGHKERLLGNARTSERIEEVGFAPEYASSRILQFLAAYDFAGDRRYLQDAVDFVPVFEANLGPQPSAWCHDIGLHHWDGFWFGKRRCWGDTMPNHWNGTGADAIAELARHGVASGMDSRRAWSIGRQVLTLIRPDGGAGCAFVYPDRVNGRPAKFLDPLANDQDWVMLYYLRNSHGRAATSGGNEARPAYGAMLRVPAAGAEFRPRVYVVKGGNWQFREACGGDRTEKDGTRRFFMRSDNGPKSDVDGVFALSKSADGVVAEWTDSPQANAKVVAGELRGILPLEDYSGGAFAADGQRTEIPSTAPKGGRIGTYRLTRFELFDVHGVKRLELGFPAAQTLGVEMSGDPKIGGKLHLCIRMSGAMKPGERYPLRMTLGVPGGLKIGPDANFRIDGGEGWVPFRSERGILAGSALDFSSLRTTGVPAGCHGRVRAVGDHFEFENRPGEALRFYGVNVCTGALMPDNPEDARAFARRLAMSGYNAVRIHHQDTWIVTSRTKGDAFKREGVTLNPQQARKFDAFVAACVENGLYLTTDLFCSRTWAIRWRDVGIDRDGLVGMGDFKNLVQVHEGVYSNYLAFARNFLGHRNEFTGRTLVEEPALGWISLVNEGCIGRSTAALEKWPEWRAAWKAWLEGKRRAEPKDYADIPEAFPADVMTASRHACAFKLFLADTESAFAAKMRRFLRDEMKCQALLTNMNGVFHPVHTREARQKNYDYIDGHFYVDHPSFLGQNWKPPSSSGTRNPITNACGGNYPALGRDYSRPFTITEWNYCAPNPHRGCAGLLVGAAAVIQGWGGLWHFDFAGGQEQYTEPEKAAMGSFVMAGDPLMRASDRTALMLYLRGDMKPVEKSFAVEVPERTFRTPTDELPSEDTWHWLNWITWYGRLGASIVPEGGRLPDGLVKVAAYPEDYRKKDYAKVFRTVTGTDADGFPSRTMPPAANGQVRVDGVKGTFFVNTPRTCGGFVPEGAFEAGGLRADVGKVAASVTASSLDRKPLAESDRILVTHLCDCVNTGIVFTDESRRILSQWGAAPQLVRKTKVPVSLAVKSGAWTVWAIDMDGRRVKTLPCAWADGRLSFSCDTAADLRQATFHYELVREDLPFWRSWLPM